MHPMRVCIFARAMPKHRPYYPVPAAMIAEVLSQLGHEVVVLTTSIRDVKSLCEKEGDVTVHYLEGTSPGVLDKRFWFSSAKKFDEFHSQGPFDLVLGRGPSTWGFFTYSRYASEIPVISHEGTYPLWMHQLERRAGFLREFLMSPLAVLFSLGDSRYRICMKRSARVVCNSPALANAFERAYWWNPPNTDFIPYGFDTSPYKIASSPSGLKNPPTLIFVGRLTWDKGVLAMLDILSSLERKDVTLEMIGPISEKVEAKVKRHAQTLGVSDRIIVSGPEFNSRIPERLSGASLFLFPSTHPEGLSKSVMEAMAAGLPVVSYRLPGIETLVEDGVTGWLVPSRSIPDAARKVDELLSDPLKIIEMGAAARRKIEDDFSPNAILERWRELLGAVVE